MLSANPCLGCLGEKKNLCCIDVFIILNQDEISLFDQFPGYKPISGGLGGVFSTQNGCPYLNNRLCQIHYHKPLYCKFYPIFITGDVYIDQSCPCSTNTEIYNLADENREKFRSLQQKYPIYREDWYWEDVRNFIFESKQK